MWCAGARHTNSIGLEVFKSKRGTSSQLTWEDTASLPYLDRGIVFYTTFNRFGQLFSLDELVGDKTSGTACESACKIDALWIQ